MNIPSNAYSDSKLNMKRVFTSSAGKEKEVSQHILMTKPTGRQGHFFGFALYLDRSRDARPLPRGFTGHVAHLLRSILHRGLPGALLCAALGKPGRLLGNPLGESPAAPSPALRLLPMSALAAW